MLKVIFWMILLWLKILKTQRRFLPKLARKSKLQKSLKLKLMKHHNFIDQQPHEVHWFISYCQTYQRFTHSTNILWSHLLMLSTELLMTLLKVWVIKKRCIKLMRMVMLLFLKLKRKRKTRRKLKSLKDNLKKLKNKLL